VVLVVNVLCSFYQFFLQASQYTISVQFSRARQQQFSRLIFTFTIIQDVQLLDAAIISSPKGSQLGFLQAPSTRAAASSHGGKQAEERYRAKVAKYEERVIPGGFSHQPTHHF
jgi:hypothetical protein